MARVPYRLLAEPRIIFSQPGTGGMVTDAPPYAIGPTQSVFAQDAVAPTGLLAKRRGWRYDGSVADVASNLVSVWRAPYVLSNATRTITCSSAGNVYIHNSGSGGTLVGSPGVPMRAACQYRDQTILCASDGVTPIRLYSGATFSQTASANTPSLVANQAIYTLGAWSWDAASVGSYIYLGGHQTSPDRQPRIYVRCVERNSATSITLESIRASSGGLNVQVQKQLGLGMTYPCVNVYSSGTVTLNSVSQRIDGTGTKWATGSWGSVTTDDGVMVLLGGSAIPMYEVAAAGSDTIILTATSRSNSDVPYQILRRCPWTDAEAHAGSLWGTGVAQFPGRVYWSPKGWNPAIPPGAVEPFDPILTISSPDPASFTLNFIDVPAEYDGDPVVALLSSPNPLLVLKRNSVYGLFGEDPDVFRQLIASGVGCIDVRSAVSVGEGQFWAGEGGIYAYRNGRVEDLTGGKINREWRDLVRNGVTYCSAGVAYGHLVVSVKTTDFARTYICDLTTGNWISQFTNVNSRAFFPSRISGEVEKLYFVSDSQQGRVMDLAPAINPSGPSADGDGTKPVFKYWSGTNLDPDEGIAGEGRLLDLQIHANICDAGASGSTQVTPSVVSSSSLASPQSSTKTLDPMNSDPVDLVDRFKRDVNRAGRLEQVRIEETLSGASLVKLELVEVAMTVRPTRSRT